MSLSGCGLISIDRGVVNIYPLTKDGNPSEEVINIVQKYLSDDKIRPLTDCVKVLTPEKIDFTVQATILLYKDADEISVKSTIDSIEILNKNQKLVEEIEDNKFIAKLSDFVDRFF